MNQQSSLVHTIFGEDNYVEFSLKPMQVLVTFVEFKRDSQTAIKMTTTLDLYDRQSQPFNAKSSWRFLN